MGKRHKKTVIFIQKYFSVLMISLAVIMLWRGVWNLLDYFLFPQNHFLSNILTIIIGLFLLFLNNFDIKEIHKKHKNGKT